MYDAVLIVLIIIFSIIFIIGMIFEWKYGGR